MDPLDPVPFHLTHQLVDELPAAAVDELVAKLGPESGRGPTVTILQLRHMGGCDGAPGARGRRARDAPGRGLREVKAIHDPGDLFAGNRHIPPTGERG